MTSLAAMLRPDEVGRPLLGSTHWPWIGERTRDPDGAHVALLSEVVNPVACKVGPNMTRPELLGLCERLDPEREAGRLTLVARIGAGRVTSRLPALVEAVRTAGHPAIWLCDPMHGNTVETATGHKTRVVPTLMREVREFVAVLDAVGGVAGGLHLETTPDDVSECVTDESGFDQVPERYTSVCDPRLTLWQAISVISAWGA
jgi:3-deoxy-7-phosphoheptulonate synthase